MQTIPDIIVDRFRSTPTKTAFWRKVDGSFEPRLWSDVENDVLRYIASFVKSGIAQGDAVSLYSENRYEWCLIDFALQLLGAIHVPIHATLSGAQAIDQTRRSYSKLMLVSTPALLKSVKEAGSCDATQTLLADFADLESNVASDSGGDLQAGREVKDSACERISPNDVATILFTSGTTGEPKGVMLTQNNLASNAIAAAEKVGFDGSDLRLTFLPLSHIFARTCDLYSWIFCGNELAIAESKETIVPDAQATRPTIMNGVPYFFATLRRALESSPSPPQPGAIKGMLGGRLRLLCSGGAALPQETFQFYDNLGTPILQGYGLTESSPVISVSNLDFNRCGSSGQPINDVEVKIADDGEILTRGPHVMLGYFEDKAATNQIIRDGWLHTGDWGHLDDDGFLFVTGRKKEIIVTATGKNVSPSNLEAMLCEDPLITQALVVGDDRKFLTALLVVNQPAILAQLDVEGFDAQSDAVQSLLESRVQSRLANCAKHEQIGKFAILSEPFTIEKAEVTAKLSLRRKVIEQNYAQEIERMYS